MAIHMHTFKGKLGWVIIILVALSPLVSWYFALLPFNLRYLNSFALLTSLGELSSLIGFTIFSIELFLSTRLKAFEDFFGGMNKVYNAHHILGGIAFVLFMMHPVFLSGAYLSISPKKSALYLLPSDDWARNFGIIAFSFLMAVLILTFYRMLSYQKWRLYHQLLGGVFFFGTIHSFFISSDISRFPMLRYQMLFFVLLGLFSYTYRTLLGKYFVKRGEYSLVYARELNKDVIEIALKPMKNPITYKPGQFIFISFKHGGISEEVHPFSISSASTEELLILEIKESGDYTKQLVNLTPDAIAVIEGAFGRFTYSNYSDKNQIWVAGGIGITPFFSMAKELPRTPDYTVDLYYSVHDEEEAVDLSELEALSAANPHFRVFPCVSTIQGRLSVDMIEKNSGEIKKKDFFICGPPPMMHSLRDQLVKHGVPNHAIHTEEFAI